MAGKNSDVARFDYKKELFDVGGSLAVQWP